MPRTLSQIEVADFRDRLCDTAAHLFATRGRDAFTLRELAGELGVSAMTPYRYFKDKDEILACVRARAFDRFARVLEAAYASTSDAAGAANATGEAYIRFALENPTAYKLMFDLSQDDSAYPDLAQAAERARMTLTRHIRPLIEAGMLQGDPELIGHVFWAMLHGAVMLKFAGKLDRDFRAIVEQAFRALVAGLRPSQN